MTVDRRKIWGRISEDYRIIVILLFIFMIIFSVRMMYSKGSGLITNGRADLSSIDFGQNKVVTLDGNWEFYWNRLLTPVDFTAGRMLQPDSYLKVPGPWDDQSEGGEAYQSHGVATYRLRLSIPPTLKDPAIHIQHIIDSYKLYANGRLIEEVGKVSDNISLYKDDEKSLILELPKDSDEIELVIQVSSLKYAGGGFRQSPIFGSERVLENLQRKTQVLQLLCIGSIFVFSIYYFLLFMLQKRNKTALFFSLLCFITVVRSLIWGEEPLLIFFPNVTFDTRFYINYLTGFNLIPIMLLFILSFYSAEYRKRSAAIVLLPTLLLDALLMFPEFVSNYSNYIYLIILLQMIYLISVVIKAVLHKRDYAILMFGATCIFTLTIVADIFYFLGIGSINLSYMFLFGNFAVIIAMSVIQVRQQADIHKKLILYNEKLIEADKLKDKVMATEMSFLKAQIKPHFLNNALNAIANVCETDGKRASKLIIDLAIYFRGSMEYNHLNETVTIEKELEFVDTYFNIEQARFGEKIQLRKEIDIPLDYRIPVLIVQPLVENAVRHGIFKKQTGGIVTLRMAQSEEGACFEIADNGVGMNSEKLATLLNESRAGQGVGLLNIHQRLLRLYGKGIDITSKEGHGTCVKIMLPEVVKQ